MSPIESNLQHIRSHIRGAIEAMPLALQTPVTVVAVSKRKAVSDVREAFAAGQRDFGESYVQEAVTKIDALGDLKACGIVWHFIGPLQSNKLRVIAANFDWVHGIDRLNTATTLSRHRIGHPALNVCVQVNISAEASKNGVAPIDALALAAQVSLLPNLKLRGLMTIIEHGVDEATQRAQFRNMRTLFGSMQGDGMDVDTLSMGMSGDFMVAIAEGATMVRIGTAIFGVRR